MRIVILKQIKNPEAIVAKVSRVLKAARASGVRTFFMRQMSLPKDLTSAFSYRKAMASHGQTFCHALKRKSR